jgi:CDP-6-deoxy-D-xylo-4-hexulose-3-dehydrase
VREVKDRDRWLKKYPDIDPRFLFVNVGYNLRPMELSGAMGLVQLPKLKQFVDVRRQNSAWFRRELAQYGDFFDFQEEQPKGHHSWFGFPIRVKANAGFKVTELTKALNARNVETRPIIAGNIARQPALKMFEHRVVGDMRHSNAVMDGAFSFGNHQDVDSGARQYVAEQVRGFLRSRQLI